MYEHRRQPLLPANRFLRRLGAHGAVALLLVLVFLIFGTLGYRELGQLTWVDAFLNSAMLLGGMGQVYNVESNSAKIFAGAFALVDGLLLILVTTIILAPVLHRILHRIHVEESDVDESGEG